MTAFSGRRGRLAALAAALLSAAAFPVAAQTPAASGPGVGDPAPDFSLVGATRFGVLRDSVRLADLRGQTVVLAFFYKARTKG